MRLSRDSGLGVIALLIAGAYYYGATQIQQSLLADAVGADGAPRLLAWAMAAVGIGLILRDATRPNLEARDDLPMQAHLRALGLLAILIVYLIATPWLGYALSIAGLLAAAAVYAGARSGVSVALTAVIGAAAFWLTFKALLGIQMPSGVLFWG